MNVFMLLKHQLHVAIDIWKIYLDRLYSIVIIMMYWQAAIFWAWGGFGRATPGHVYWQRGDEYLGDPAQEEQGLNAVFDIDPTISLIREYTYQINTVR